MDSVVQLCKALEIANVNYCHWKSNEAIDRSASADNDLDLLVAREDAACFAEIVHRCGFKETREPAVDQLPGVVSYYGYDAEADKIIHIHTHYQLILGHDRTKNFRLPIEAAYLASAQQQGLFRLPSYEFEYIVFTIRMVLKYSTWDATLNRQAKMPKSSRRERDFLQERIGQHEVDRLLAEHLPHLDKQLFEDCVKALQPSCPRRIHIRASRHLQKWLAPFSRRPLVKDIPLKLWRRNARMVQRRIRKHLPKQRFVSSGMMIAFVGGDGSGKSTAIGSTYKWLAHDFDVIRIHMGKPPRSFVTHFARAGLKVGRRMTAFMQRNGDAAEGQPAPFVGYSRLIWELCTARDRYRNYTKARRFAIDGGIVISDRFPLPMVKLMDGPLIEQLVPPEQRNWLINYLARWEKSYYPTITSPELLFVLHVDPEIAVARKVEENPQSVRRRSTEIWELDWRDSQAHVIDASQPADVVLKEIKQTIWSTL